MGVSALPLADHHRQLEDVNAQIQSSNCESCPLRRTHTHYLAKTSALSSYVGELRRALSNDNVPLVEEFELRKHVLESLQYIDDDGTVQLKGRVACEVNTCDSLIVTELVFENLLVNLEPPEICALLSCLIFQQRNRSDPVLSSRLEEAKSRLVTISTAVANIQLKAGVDIVPSEFVRENVNDGLMQVVHEWAQGTAFKDVCELTDVPEGTIVRTIMRLDETCRDVRNAARVIGDPTLYQVMVKCSEIIRRDICFAASLYVS
jgi:antiviral helicase SKI2